MTKSTTKTWDQYAAEADAPDFVLHRTKDDPDPIHVTNPTGARMLRVAQGTRAGDLDAILLGLCGEAYPEVNKLVAKAGHKALPRLVEDIMDHFDLYEDIELEGPGGGTVTARRPTEVQKLVRMGYSPKA